MLMLSLLASGSGGMPSSREMTRSRWKTFDEAKAAFDRVVPHQNQAPVQARANKDERRSNRYDGGFFNGVSRTTRGHHERTA